jgi:tetratricopeptide (TPR) repeat protein
VAAARGAFDAGDRTRALRHLDEALSIDPSFLAAQLLRERVLAATLAPAAPLAPAPPPDSPHQLPAKRMGSREAYERIEVRARQRRIDHCIAATRAALGRQQPEAAAAALSELIALEPDESNVASLSAELTDLRRRFARRPFGARLAAAAVFFAVAGTASWIDRPRLPTALVKLATSVRTTEPAAEAGIPVASAISVPEVAGGISVPDGSDRERRTSRLESRSLVARRPLLAPSVAPSPLVARALLQPPSAASSPLVARAPLPPPAAAPSPLVTRAPLPPLSVASRQASAASPRPVSTPATAPLSLPVPLSQLPTAAAITPREPPAATIATAAPVEPAPIRARSDKDLVEDALQRYRRAYGRLNAQSAQAVYPTVNRVALARAFDGLESQSLTFDSCDVEVRGILARAICHGTARYVPKIGNRYPHTEPLVWSFELRKSNGDWTIYYAKASR